MSVVRVLRAGLSSTIQDYGRPAFRQFGVPVCGAMDRVSHELANLLVGNPPASATIEMTLLGDEFEFSEESVVSITGAEMSPVMIPNGSKCEVAIPCQNSIVIPAGSRLRFHAARRGCRTYVAVRGGFDVPLVMNSRATYLKAGIGGFRGRPLKAGDELQIGRSASSFSAHMDRASDFPNWFVRPVDLPHSEKATLRMIRGSHFDCLTQRSQCILRTEFFHISPQSDRMGYRLSGTPLKLNQTVDLLSAGTAIGTIQLPADGNPILLLADCAPTGGYPRIAHVITADLPKAAQLRPGQLVSFEEVTIGFAQQMYERQRSDLRSAVVMNGLLKSQQGPAMKTQPVTQHVVQTTEQMHVAH